jgi:four helix bundle protein
LKIRQFTIEIANELLDIGDELERRKLYRFADQLRGAGMPMSNNIAEGSGSNSTKEFRQFLNMARRSPFENVNILILLKKIYHKRFFRETFGPINHLCRQVTNFQNSLTQ